MLISQLQHDAFQLGVTNQVATRLGIADPEIHPENELLELMSRRDADVYLATIQFKNTYREWYRASVELEQAVEGNRADAEAIRDRVRDLRTRRDHQRKLVVGQLDAHYPLHSSALLHGG
jgi:hypothetical protein